MDKKFLARPSFLRAEVLKLSTTAARMCSLTTIVISDIGVRSAISQATTEATLCLAADAGRVAMPMCASTSEIPVRTHHVSFVLNRPECAHLRRITRFPDYGAPNVRQKNFPNASYEGVLSITVPSRTVGAAYSRTCVPHRTA